MVATNEAVTSLLSLSGFWGQVSLGKGNLNIGCEALDFLFPGKTFRPSEDVYKFEKTNFWSNHEILSPSCVFRPTESGDVAVATLLTSILGSKFAVRGGGHMGIKGANSIDDGVLVVMSNLTTLELAQDKNSVWVGPGLDWGEVYTYLDDYDLAVAGGRLAPVGVPGLLLGGGINYHGNQVGWSADNVLEYEVVLSSGIIATASATENTDLFWALKGGSNNYGIVTKFKLRTFHSGDIYAGVYSVTDIPAFLSAVANFSASNTDPLAHIVPQVVAADESTTVGAAILYYDSDANAEPDCFRPFFDIPNVSNTFSKKRLAPFAVETGGLVTPGINDMFIAGTTVGKDYASLLKGVQLVNDIFLGELPALYKILPKENRVLLTVDWQPIGDLWAAGSKKSNPGGNALGIDTSKGTYLAWAEVVEWTGDQYTDAVYTWIQATTKKIEDATKAAGIYDKFYYMGDAAGFQTQVYQGYGADNQKKLLQISRKYDPLRLFQKLWPGGFKIGN